MSAPRVWHLLQILSWHRYGAVASAEASGRLITAPGVWTSRLALLTDPWSPGIKPTQPQSPTVRNEIETHKHVRPHTNTLSFKQRPLSSYFSLIFVIVPCLFWSPKQESYKKKTFMYVYLVYICCTNKSPCHHCNCKLFLCVSLMLVCMGYPVAGCYVPFLSWVFLFCLACFTGPLVSVFIVYFYCEMSANQIGLIGQ